MINHLGFGYTMKLPFEVRMTQSQLLGAARMKQLEGDVSYVARLGAQVIPAERRSSQTPLSPIFKPGVSALDANECSTLSCRRGMYMCTILSRR